MGKNNKFKRKIIKELYFQNVLSCAEISDRINKSIPLTTKLLSELVDAGSIIENGLARSTGGRRPITYSIRKDTMYVVSVAMDQYVTRLAVMDMQNQFVTKITYVEIPLKNNPEALTILIKEIDQFIHQSQIPKSKIIGVGIGMPGFVDIAKGVNYSFLTTENKSIKDLLSEQINLPVFIDNDSSLIALAELKFGAGRNENNVMVINISWGVGLGLILNNEIFRGHNGFAGEFSHIPIFQNGILCSCGKSGCLETETSLLVIIEKAREGLKNGRLSMLNLSALEHLEQASEALVRASARGDQFTVELFSEAGYNIGRGVAILIHLLNPSVIILSGRGSTAGNIWKAPIQQALNEHCIPRLAASTTIEISELGHQAELIGAACLVMENWDKMSDTLNDAETEFEHALRK